MTHKILGKTLIAIEAFPTRFDNQEKVSSKIANLKLLLMLHQWHFRREPRMTA